MMIKEKVGIIGFGRFGQVLAKLLQNDFSIVVYDKKTKPVHEPIKFATLSQVLQCKIIFIATPIRDFENVIQTIANQLVHDATIFDVCSVKVHPVTVMKKHLPKSVGIIATHPLFGPDSFHQDQSLKMVMYPKRDNQHIYFHWKNFFENKNINIIELTPEAHDQQAALSQGVTHFIGRVLQQANIKPTQIDTLGFKKLLEIMQQTCDDTMELFYDLQHYNPYSKAMLNQLETAFKTVMEKLRSC